MYKIPVIFLELISLSGIGHALSCLLPLFCITRKAENIRGLHLSCLILWKRCERMKHCFVSFVLGFVKKCVDF